LLQVEFSAFAGLLPNTPGPLCAVCLAGELPAAELAALPFLDLMTSDIDWVTACEGGGAWAQLACLERVEVYRGRQHDHGPGGRVGSIVALVAAACPRLSFGPDGQ
jgi:hypothetical protein